MGTSTKGSSLLPGTAGVGVSTGLGAGVAAEGPEVTPQSFVPSRNFWKVWIVPSLETGNSKTFPVTQRLPSRFCTTAVSPLEYTAVTLSMSTFLGVVWPPW